MGTINYRTSDYITIGAAIPSAYELENDPDFMQELRENNGLTADEDASGAVYDYIYDILEDDRANAAAILAKYSFYYFHVAIVPGYYEGFSIDIENNFPICFDDYHERKEALAEVREVESALRDLSGVGLVSVFPGWCTTYHDYKTTLHHIRKAVQEMRAEIRSTPTYRQYCKG